MSVHLEVGNHYVLDFPAEIFILEVREHCCIVCISGWKPTGGDFLIKAVPIAKEFLKIEDYEFLKKREIKPNTIPQSFLDELAHNHLVFAASPKEIVDTFILACKKTNQITDGYFLP